MSVDALFDIAGKTALITGGTRGIGLMIATAFVERGAKVIVTARNGEQCHAVAEKLGSIGDCTGFAADLSAASGIEAVADFASKHAPVLDILVNNAGAAWGEPFETFSESGWDRVFDLNVKSTFFLTQKLHQFLAAAAKANGRARVINIGSIEGETLPVDRGSFAYPASKAAVHHLTRVMAGRLVADGITVNAIAPGPFESKMTAHLFASNVSREAVEALVPMQRIGRPDDMAGLATFLASAASDFITGTTIPLDGGYTNLR
jgi:NAD(P)-dependent dehydrogenase (short-subunit alcohol dehydrogenase family)